MLNNFSITDQECTGCGACVNACSHNAIRFALTDGFYRPQINMGLCVDCGLCKKVCPQNNLKEKTGAAEIYAGFAIEDTMRSSGSSGGIFGVIAEHFCKTKSAVIASVAFDEHLDAVFCTADRVEDLAKFKKSKYVQANPNTIYKDVLRFLKEGETVLFAGMPCQVAAVKSLCKKCDANLFCIDYICHGVPSPAIWKKIVAETEVKAGRKVVHVDFRYKDGEKWDWNNFAVRTIFEDGNTQDADANTVSYFWAFLRNYLLQKACFSCCYRAGNSYADITLGDFWEIEKTIPSFSEKADADKGISAICVNTDKGRKLLQEIKGAIDLQLASADQLVAGNPCYVGSVDQPKGQEKYLKCLLSSKHINISKDIDRMLTYVAFKERMMYRMKRIVSRK